MVDFVSPNKAVDPAVYPDDITRQIATELAGATVFRFDMSDLQPPEFGGTPGQGSWAGLQDFLAHPTEIDRITQEMADAANKAFGG